MSERAEPRRTIAVRGGKLVVLLALFRVTCVRAPEGLSDALGARHWLTSQGLGPWAFLYLFILSGLVIIACDHDGTTAHGALPGALLELGVLPFGFRGILIALLSVATMIVVVLVSRPHIQRNGQVCHNRRAGHRRTVRRGDPISRLPLPSVATLGRHCLLDRDGALLACVCVWPFVPRPYVAHLAAGERRWRGLRGRGLSSAG